MKNRTTTMSPVQLVNRLEALLADLARVRYTIKTLLAEARMQADMPKRPWPPEPSSRHAVDRGLVDLSGRGYNANGQSTGAPAENPRGPLCP